MLNKTTLKEAATAAFNREINRTIDFIVDRCWISNLPAHTEELMTLLQAAEQMEVLEGVIPPDEKEIAELIADLKPLRTLKMSAEARAHIIAFLADRGVPALTFASTVSDKEA